MNATKFLFAVAVSTLSAGCATDPPRPDTSAVMSYRLERVESALDALARQQQRTDCLVRLNAVTLACMTIYAGEPNLSLQNKVGNCVRSKGFPQAPDVCQ